MTTISVTKTVFRVTDFLGWLRQGKLDLRPEFQRNSVWSKQSKSYFIDSILKGFPIPILFLQDQADPKTFEPTRQVVDGQQRLRTVLGFVDSKAIKDFDKDQDDFKISKTHNPALGGKRFLDLNQVERQAILNFEFSVHILPVGTPDKLLLQIFARMNSTGMKANEQELRNAAWSGEFKQVSYDLAFDYTDEWTSWDILSKTNIARMKEVELTSELLMLICDGMTGKTQSAIDSYYAANDDEFKHKKEAIRRFEKCMGAIGLFLGVGDSASSIAKLRTQAWFYCLFAVVHEHLFGGPITDKKTVKTKPIPANFRSKLAKLSAKLEAEDMSPELLKAIRGASDDMSSRTLRLEVLRKL